jgi:hypothetical protein
MPDLQASLHIALIHYRRDVHCSKHQAIFLALPLNSATIISAVPLPATDQS